MRSMLLFPALLLTAAALPVLPAWAAEAAGAAGAADGAEGAASEIVVTASKRGETLHEIPLAVSVAGREALQRAGVDDLRALDRITPSLLVSSSSSEANGGVARIRGVGTVGDNPGLESSVAVFVDGVYRPRSGVALTELGDVDRIEVLRGPQGTLFGRNASAGLINIVTRKPEFQALGNAEATLGSHGNRRFLLGVTGPLAKDVLAYRLDGVLVRRDGFIRELESGRQINNRDRWLLRGQLLFTPSSDLSVRLIADAAKRKEECCAGGYLPFRMAFRAADGTTQATPDNPIAAILQGLGKPLVDQPDRREVRLTPGQSFKSHVTDRGLSAEIDWNPGAFSLTSISAARNWKIDGAQDADYTYLDLLQRQQQNRAFRNLSEELRLNGKAFHNRLDWLFGAYLANERLTTSDNLHYGDDFARYASCVVANGLAGDAAGLGHPGLLSIGAPGCVDPVAAGALVVDPAAPAALTSLAALWSGTTFPGLYGYDAAAAAAGVPGASLAGAGIALDRAVQKSNSIAFFTHDVVTLIEDRLQLTLGARWTSEKKTLAVDFRGNNPLCAALATNSALQQLAAMPCAISPLNFAGTTARRERQWTGVVALSFTPTADLTFWANASRGYKAGGFNIDRAGMDWRAPDLAALGFAPEKVDALEAGFRLARPFYALSLTGFRSVYRGFQLNTFNGIQFIVENIEACSAELVAGRCDPGKLRGGVTSAGFEGEASFTPGHDLRFDAGFSWARTRYRDRLVGAGGAPLPVALQNLPGHALSNAPAFVQTASFGWTPRISSYLGGLLHADYRLQSGINTGSDLFPEKYQGRIFITDLRLGLNGDNAAWSFELWATNLFNVQYEQVAFGMPLQGSGSIAQTIANGTPQTTLFGAFMAEPRMMGVTVRTRF